MTKTTWSSDVEYCRRIMQEQSKTFYLALRGLPPSKRQAVWAFYAFNRRLDDLGDRQQNATLLHLEEQQFHAMLQGQICDDPIYRALAAVHHRFPIDAAAVDAMFQGQYHDATGISIQTEEDFYQYCYQVAGSVGEMLLPIVATTHRTSPALKDSARNLGIAMQITNILRDVAEDVHAGRIYLPRETLDAYDVDLAQCVAHGPTEHYLALWEHYASMAVSYYQKGLEHIQLYDKDSGFLVYAAAYLYSRILPATRKNHYGLRGRTSLSGIQKTLLYAQLYVSKGVIPWNING